MGAVPVGAYTLRCVESAREGSRTITVRGTWGEGTGLKAMARRMTDDELHLSASEKYEIGKASPSSATEGPLTVRLDRSYVGQRIYDGTRLLAACKPLPH
ncbi:hypothetical protein PZ938_08445 [Luteipulveratus sp. YIM 133132]|uniref:hypothetical protein n=1 Tax=Luteipulveratus flavus TaxID=3031728 RepID=UPI0023AF182A|nr:hypothetical protein [Luteipulveratus sp. YIM 133132]MDE9365634.1 hypothetical protein [Luteipulveratus sp. YIM 133132]